MSDEIFAPQGSAPASTPGADTPPERPTAPDPARPTPAPAPEAAAADKTSSGGPADARPAGAASAGAASAGEDRGSGGAPGAGEAGDSPSAPARKRRRRGSRGGRNRSRTTSDNAVVAEDSEAGDDTDGDNDEPMGDQDRHGANGQSDAGRTSASRSTAGAGRNAGNGPSSGPSQPKSNGAVSEPPRPQIGDTLPPRPKIGDTIAPRPQVGDQRPAPGGVPAISGSRSGSGSDNGRGNGEPGRGTGTGAGAAARSEAGERRRRRRGGRGKGGERPDRRPVEAVIVDDPVKLDELTLERRRGRERKGRPVGRYMMVVHSTSDVTQIAVLEGRSLIEHYVSRPSDDATHIDGNIYLGRVQNVLPGMEAAFIDIGTPKNAVLYRGDVRYDKDEIETAGGDGSKPTRGKLPGPAKDARIEQLLKTGQTVLCQVTKNPIGTKGARLTQEVSLPGRFVVLIPGSDTYGISKRLADDERKRLRRILDEVRPAGHGLIVRTAAEGATADELRRDVARLTQQWQRIDSMAKNSRAPALLYREPDMAVRVIREEFNRNYRGVIIDDEALYEEVRDYVGSINPELADRIEWSGDPTSEFAGDPLPIFERYHVHEQIHKALDRKVWLPSGGSLIIERTEALTVIDVNTGKNVGTSNLEETVFRNNLEAAEEIAHQLRLRDIGGIIVIDFIDMEIAGNRNEVIKTFRAALARDKTRTQVFDISELGLVEMTRKRISEGLVESFSEACPTCGGRGIVFDESLL